MPKLLDHFGLLAPFYERFIRPKISEKFWRLVDTCAGQQLLDAGGGTGRISAQLIGKGIQVVIADESFEMLGVAKQKKELQPLRTHTEGLPFAEDTFDRIIMVDALHHVSGQRQTAGELLRVLKPGGRLVIEEPNLDLFIVKLLALGEKLLLMRSHFLSPRKISQLFSAKEAGVRVEYEDGLVWIIVEK